MKLFKQQTKLVYATTFFLIIISIIESLFNFKLLPYLRIVDRIVFTMLLVFFADSFYSSNNKKKFMLHLFIMSVVMPIIILINRTFFSSITWFGFNDMGATFFRTFEWLIYKNIFTTLFIIGLLNYGWDFLVDAYKHKSVSSLFKGIGMILTPIIITIPLFEIGMTFGRARAFPPMLEDIASFIFIITPSLLTVGGGAAVVLLGWLYYIFREKRKIQALILLIFSILIFLLYPSRFDWMRVFAIIPLYYYNRIMLNQEGGMEEYDSTV